MSIIFEVFNGRHQNQVYFSSSGMSTGIHDCNIGRSILMNRIAMLTASCKSRVRFQTGRLLSARDTIVLERDIELQGFETF